MFNCLSQNCLYISVIGKDKIEVENRNPYAVEISFYPYLISHRIKKNNKCEIYTSLNNYSVQNRVIKVARNKQTFILDSQTVVNHYFQEFQAIEDFNIRISALLIISNNCDWEALLILLKGLHLIIPNSSPKLDLFLSKLVSNDYTYLSCNEKYAKAIDALSNTCELLKVQNEAKLNQEISKLTANFKSLTTQNLYLSDFIRKHEYARTQFSIGGLLGFRVPQIHKVDSIKGYTILPYKQIPSWEMKYLHSFNAYTRSGFKKAGIQNTLSIGISKSRTISNFAPNRNFNSKKSYSWYFLSAGFGKVYSAGFFNVYYEIGLNSNILVDGGYDTFTKKTDGIKNSKLFKGFAPYFAFGYHIILTDHICINLSGQSPLLYKLLGFYDRQLMPKYRYANIGLIFTIKKSYTYQY